MTFISPGFLWALAAVSVPLLLHLVRRRRIRVLRWAAWQFLVQSQQRLRRRLRLEQMILAAIRALIVALIVLAFARPVIRSRAIGQAGSGPIHAVIALDNSASMGFERAGETDFERARKAADQIISSTLKPGDAVSVVLASANPRPLVKHPSHDLEGVRRTIRRAPLSGYGTDYARTARLCLEICEAGRASRREVYVITDSQRSGFPGMPGTAEADTWRRLSRLARITWIHVAADSRPNASVLPPMQSRDFVIPGAPVRIESEVVNRTDGPLRSATARLEVETRTAGATALQIAKGETARAAFTHTFDRPGTHYGRIVLDRPDGLASDNSGWFAVHVRKALRVLVVGPTTSGASVPDTLYVATALSPAGASEGGAAQVTSTVRNALSDSGMPLRSFDVVVLAGPSNLSAAELRALRGFVEAGGGLLAFPAASGGTGLATVAGEREEALWPVRIGSRRQLPLDRAPSLDAATITRQPLLLFRSAETTDLGAARFTTTYDLGVPDTGGSRSGTARQGRPQTILRFSDGRPAIIERALGNGRAILCAFSAGVDGGDLPLKAAYVPLIHQLVAYLASARSDERMLSVGQPAALTFGIEAGQKTFSIARKAALPDEADRIIASSLRGVPGPDAVMLRCPPPTEPGLYEVTSDAVDLSDGFAANLDPRETDLTVARPDVIAGHAGSIPITFAHEGDDIGRVVRSSRYGSEFWPALIVSALILMAAETYLARAFGRRT
ncbi:MAG: VWA domain-containing protein [Chthonomonadales bacterium]|nr:VWA domain-containing protein [Chthonomonadales bacterium]